MTSHITHLMIGLLIVSSVLSLRVWSQRANLLTAVCFLLSWTATAVLTAFALQGIAAATLTWFLAPPYAVLLLWALEPSDRLLEPHRDAIVPPEPLVHPAPDADWQDDTQLHPWFDEEPTVPHRYTFRPKV